MGSGCVATASWRPGERLGAGDAGLNAPPNMHALSRSVLASFASFCCQRALAITKLPSRVLASQVGCPTSVSITVVGQASQPDCSTGLASQLGMHTGAQAQMPGWMEHGLDEALSPDKLIVDTERMMWRGGERRGWGIRGSRTNCQVRNTTMARVEDARALKSGLLKESFRVKAVSINNLINLPLL